MGWRAVVILAIAIGALAARAAVCRPCAVEARFVAAPLVAAGW